MPRPTRRARADVAGAPGPRAAAERLHSAAIHLLRRLRRADDASGLSAPRLSALSVLVVRGPCTLGELAAAEQVRAPTMTRLVTALEHDGLVTRASDPADGRVTRVSATAEGRRVLAAGRARRVRLLARDMARLPADDHAALVRALAVLERLADATP
jgi:DNA-binding MarR family transcriptional regulator